MLHYFFRKVFYLNNQFFVLPKSHSKSQRSPASVGSLNWLFELFLNQKLTNRSDLSIARFFKTCMFCLDFFVWFLGQLSSGQLRKLVKSLQGTHRFFLGAPNKKHFRERDPTWHFDGIFIEGRGKMEWRNTTTTIFSEFRSKNHVLLGSQKTWWLFKMKLCWKKQEIEINYEGLYVFLRRKPILLILLWCKKAMIFFDQKTEFSWQILQVFFSPPRMSGGHQDDSLHV